MKSWTAELIVYALVWWAISVAAVHGGQVDVPVIRNVSGSGPAADMKSRLRDWNIISGEDVVGTGHYCGHGLHSQIRNQHGGTNNVNAVYCGRGVAWVFPEPRGVRISEVVRGPSPTLASASWENQPLYLLDEFGSYVSGTVCGLCDGDRSMRTRGSYRFARQMLTQCRRLVVVCRQRGYPQVDELSGVVEGGAEVLDEIGKVLGE